MRRSTLPSVKPGAFRSSPSGVPVWFYSVSCGTNWRNLDSTIVTVSALLQLAHDTTPINAHLVTVGGTSANAIGAPWHISMKGARWEPHTTGNNIGLCQVGLEGTGIEEGSGRRIRL